MRLWWCDFTSEYEQNLIRKSRKASDSLSTAGSLYWSESRICTYLIMHTWNPFMTLVLIAKGHLLEGWIPKIEDFHRFQVYINNTYLQVYFYLSRSAHWAGRFCFVVFQPRIYPAETADGFHLGFRAIVRVVVLCKAALFDEENLRFTYWEHLNRFLYGYFCQDAELRLLIWQMTCNWQLFVEDDWMKSKFYSLQQRGMSELKLLMGSIVFFK